LPSFAVRHIPFLSAWREVDANVQFLDVEAVDHGPRLLVIRGLQQAAFALVAEKICEIAGHGKANW
jgi:hypothetical protein